MPRKSQHDREITVPSASAQHSEITVWVVPTEYAHTTYQSSTSYKCIWGDVYVVGAQEADDESDTLKSNVNTALWDIFVKTLTKKNAAKVFSAGDHFSEADGTGGWSQETTPIFTLWAESAVRSLRELLPETMSVGHGRHARLLVVSNVDFEASGTVGRKSHPFFIQSVRTHDGRKGSNTMGGLFLNSAWEQRWK